MTNRAVSRNRYFVIIKFFGSPSLDFAKSRGNRRTLAVDLNNLDGYGILGNTGNCKTRRDAHDS